MGQAKQRKATDPNYGAPSISTVRGLIITSPMETNGVTFQFKSAILDPQELRTSLLYWDRLLMPTKNIVQVNGYKDLEYLISTGVLTEASYPISGDIAKEMAKLPGKVLSSLEEQEPGVWSLGSGPNSILVNTGFSDSGEGTLLTLKNALPTPGSGVPLSEILEFRQRRRPELLALRKHLDSLVDEISQSSDSEAELNTKLGQLDEACADLAKVCKEWGSPINLTNLKASFNFSIAKAVSSAVATWTSCGEIGLSATSSAFATGAAAIQSQIDFKPDINFRSIKRPRSPFKYVYEVQRNLQVFHD